MRFFSFTVVCLLVLISCGAGKPKAPMIVGLAFDMPQELRDLEGDHLLIQGSVWSADGRMISETRDTARTIKGHYALEATGVGAEQSYEFRLDVYYQADAVGTPAAKAINPQPVFISPSITDCPNLTLTPDASLVDARWLRLCQVRAQYTLDPKVPILIPAGDINCGPWDADGDGMNNLQEMASSVEPFVGDADGDCVADGADAFPKDAAESVDTDGDGVGDNSDADADNDGISDADEIAQGTRPFEADSDHDGIIDGTDNCPLVADNDLGDGDGDGLGNPCDDDADNDGLGDAGEQEAGTGPLDTDSDDDGATDGDEVHKFHTRPLASDTDGDGALDGKDAFPLDPLELADSDGDGIGDGADNCLATANSSQTNVDFDSLGDACDDDSDNDNIPDTVEMEAGLNPFSRDTDGDGRPDSWGANYQPGLLAGEVAADACPLADAGVNHADSDGDAFGDGCDCAINDASIHPAAADDPDGSGMDSDCDGVDGRIGNAVFVDAAYGDGGDGSREAPFTSLKDAARAAAAKQILLSRPIYVIAAQGTYEFTREPLTLESSIAIYGGYAGANDAFGNRDIADRVTLMTTSSLDTLIRAHGTSRGTMLDGVTLESAIAEEAIPLVISLTQGYLTIRNSTLILDHPFHGTLIEAVEGTLELTGNDLGVINAANSAIGVSVTNVSGSWSANHILIRDAASRTAIECFGATDGDITMTDNQIDVWVGTVNAGAGNDAAQADFIYLGDCSRRPSQFHYLPPVGGLDVSGFEGFADGGGNILDGLF